MQLTLLYQKGADNRRINYSGMGTGCLRQSW